MQVENLEQRLALSVSLANGVLSIVGTDRNDSILVERSGNQFVVTSSADGVKRFPFKTSDKIRIDGRGGNDTLHVENPIRNASTIRGGAGNDSILGGSGKDLVDGGAGRDTLCGRNGDDRIVDPSTNNHFDGGSGFDAVDFSALTSGINFQMAGKNLEVAIGGKGADRITGTNKADVIIGNGGNDTLDGLGGNDVIAGGAGKDRLLGRGGNDFFINFDREIDTIDGGTGLNFAQDDRLNGKPIDKTTNLFENIDRKIQNPSSSSAITSLTAAPIETLRSASALALSAAAAVAPAPTLRDGVLSISGTGSADSISAILDSTGRNISVSVNGQATTFALAGIRRVSIDAGAGNDTISLQRADGSRALTVAASIIGGNGNDVIVGGSGRDIISGGIGNDQISGMAGGDNLNGNLGDDVIDGGSGDDLLNGSSSDLAIADGADVIRGGPGNDTVDYSQRFNAVNIDLSVGTKANDGEAGEKDNVDTDIENVLGGNGADNIVGNNSSNLISGGPGNDTIKGLGGNDKFIGGSGADNLQAGGSVPIFAILDFARDTINASLTNGRATTAFVFGDVGMDISTRGGVLR